MSFLLKGLYTSYTYNNITIPDYLVVASSLLLTAGFIYWYTKPVLKDTYYILNKKYLTNLKYNGLHSSEIKLDNVSDTCLEMKNIFKSNYTKIISNRIKALSQLLKLVTENEKEICNALYQDFGRHELLGYAYEIGPVVNDIKLFIKNCRKWSQPERMSIDLFTFPSIDYHVNEPYGTVFINGIWNFPFQLIFTPLAGAICAGNNAIVKPCNTSLNSCKKICDLLHKYMDPKFVQVIGHPSIADDRTMTAKILENEFDFIFFTGSTNGGKYIMSQAAKYLTPVVLELGGKNPVLIDKTANLALAAKQIIFARVINGGQQCISPDYCLIESSIFDEFKDTCIKTMKEWYKTPFQSNKDQCNIISDFQFNKVISMLKSTKGTIIYGGKNDIKTKRIEPTLVECNIDDPTINDETFGPILWLIKINNIYDGIEYINNKPKSLSLYLFSNNKKIQNIVANNISSGGLQINGTITYAAHHDSRFGGVGKSGIGNYHGKNSFVTFTHKKPVVKSLIEVPIIYPPYNDWKLKILKFVM